mmetsp:Transcript_23031/g.47346  ORF Transcript_23031/g.47346 Transcript_23031/m.47346 type:complete len:420 (-) Transcript_23031:469-1728(-)
MRQYQYTQSADTPIPRRSRPSQRPGQPPPPRRLLLPSLPRRHRRPPQSLPPRRLPTQRRRQPPPPPSGHVASPRRRRRAPPGPPPRRRHLQEPIREPAPPHGGVQPGLGRSGQAAGGRLSRRAASSERRRHDSPGFGAGGRVDVGGRHRRLGGTPASSGTDQEAKGREVHGEGGRAGEEIGVASRVGRAPGEGFQRRRGGREEVGGLLSPGVVFRRDRSERVGDCVEQCHDGRRGREAGRECRRCGEEAADGCGECHFGCREEEDEAECGRSRRVGRTGRYWRARPCGGFDFFHRRLGAHQVSDSRIASHHRNLRSARKSPPRPRKRNPRPIRRNARSHPLRRRRATPRPAHDILRKSRYRKDRRRPPPGEGVSRTRNSAQTEVFGGRTHGFDCGGSTGDDCKNARGSRRGERGDSLHR